LKGAAGHLPIEKAAGGTMSKNRRWWTCALLVTAGIVFSAIGSRGSGRQFDVAFVAGFAAAMAGFLSIAAWELATGWIGHARGVQRTLGQIFPGLRWSWPMAILISLGLCISYSVLEVWWHAPPEKSEILGDLQWFQGLPNQSDKQH
jgi:hypothetical protein